MNQRELALLPVHRHYLQVESCCHAPGTLRRLVEVQLASLTAGQHILTADQVLAADLDFRARAPDLPDLDPTALVFLGVACLERDPVSETTGQGRC